MFVGTSGVIREYFLANNLNSGQNLVLVTARHCFISYMLSLKLTKNRWKLPSIDRRAIVVYGRSVELEKRFAIFCINAYSLV